MEIIFNDTLVCYIQDPWYGPVCNFIYMIRKRQSPQQNEMRLRALILVTWINLYLLVWYSISDVSAGFFSSEVNFYSTLPASAFDSLLICIVQRKHLTKYDFVVEFSKNWKPYNHNIPMSVYKAILNFLRQSLQNLIFFTWNPFRRTCTGSSW